MISRKRLLSKKIKCHQFSNSKALDS